MKKSTIKIISVVMALTILLLNINPVIVAANSFENKISTNEELIKLENGEKVTIDELIDRLYEYEGPIIVENPIIEKNSHLDSKISLNMFRANSSIPINEMVKLLGGTVYIPGIGKIVLTGVLVYLGAQVITTLGQAAYNKIVDWLSVNYNKTVDEAVSAMNNNKKHHILKDKHVWGRLVPGSPGDPNFWERVKVIIKRVLKNGKEEYNGTNYYKRLKINGEIVEVRYNKINGKIRIGTAFVEE